MIYELFSHRRKKYETSGTDDVYQYTTVSLKLRVQIQQILNEAVGPQFEVDTYSISTTYHNPEAWNTIHKILCREFGRHRLTERHYILANEGVLHFIGTANADEFVDTIEVCCRFIDRVIRDWTDYSKKEHGIKQNADDALAEINYRMREENFGFQYADGQIFRVDTEYAHEQVIKPALRVLSGQAFAGAQQEFLRAHRHYRAGEYPQAITEAAKSFESALKSTCDIKGWEYNDGARISDLLKVIRANGLWPSFLDASFDQLTATLGSGLPKVRNEQGAHGQGSAIRRVPEYVAAYALHLAAAKIRLVSEAAQT